MGQFIRSMDWSSTPLGRLEDWPQSLRFATNLALSSSFSTSILWGKELIRIYNDAFRLTIGQYHPQAIGRSARDGPPAVWALNKPVFDKVMMHGETVHLEDQLIQVTRDSYPEDAYFTLSYSPIRIEDGRVGGILVTLIETTQRILAQKKIEKALLESKANYRELVEGANSVIIRMDSDGKITFFNDYARRFFGYSQDEIIGRNVKILLPSTETSTGRNLEEMTDHILENPDRFIENINENIRKNGERVWISWRNKAIRDSKGNITGNLAIGQDITERKRAEEALRKSHEELEIRVQERTKELKRQAEMLNLSHDAIIMRDMEGIISFWSDGAREMYGWTREEALGKTGRDLLHIEFPIPQDELRARLIQIGHWEGELTLTRKSGEKVRVLSRWSLQRDEQGKPAGVMTISHDITERLKLEEQLRQAQKMDALGTLAGGIAHDFNNLLQPILINTELALLDIQEGKLPSIPSLQLVREATKHGQELVKQIITFSRQKEQSRKPVEINPIIKEALKFLRSTLPTTIEIRERMEAEPAVVLADPTQIYQVLMNLCSNAAHAMRDRRGILEVSLARVEMHGDLPVFQGGLKPGSYLRLTVKDNGHGMSRDVRERAFDPFFTMKKPGEGTGMGLAVVHGIVQKHEGAITLESEVEKGTTVSVFLPRVQESHEEELSVLGPILRGEERILLVDDEESLVSSAKSMLERLGYRVTGKTDVREALEVFRSKPDSFDLVITDQTMPYLTGESLARELLGIRSDISIILCTGFSEVIDEEGARAIGVRDFVMKPFTLREMANVIRRALTKK